MCRARPGPNRCAPRKARPTCLFIVQDDTGFGQMGCYGSPIKTPNIDALAANGLLFNSMHTTALCSPTRSCILTGRNHHSNAMSCITEGSTGYPGGNGYIPFENGFLSEMLLEHGYNTFALGKWHLTPADQISRGRALRPLAARPRVRALLRLPRAATRTSTTRSWCTTTTRVEPEKTPEEGYHLTEDLVDKAISFIADAKQVAPNKPFFMYFCPGRRARAAPRAEGVGRQVQGPVRRRLGRVSGEGVHAAEGAGHHPEGRRALASRSRRAGLEQRCRPTRRSCTRA